MNEIEIQTNIFSESSKICQPGIRRKSKKKKKNPHNQNIRATNTAQCKVI